MDLSEDFQSLIGKCLGSGLQKALSRVPLSGAPNDSFLSNPFKYYFRLCGELCRFISGSAVIFLSVRSF